MELRAHSLWRDAAVIACMALVASCGGGNDKASPTQPTPAPPTATLNYAAVGASDAVGIGASVPCIPGLPCPTGTGYVPLIARQLSTGTTTVVLTNLGIPGAVIGPDIQMLGRSIPANFIQHELPQIPADTNLVTIWAGGNDTRTIASAIDGGAAGSNVPAYVAAQIRAFGSDYATLIQGIRQKAPAARIIVANLPNFVGLPYAVSSSTRQKQILQELSVGFDREVINVLVSQAVPVVDLLCDPRAYLTSNFSSDGFHPNDSGYAILAAQMVAAFTSSSFPAPQASCPQMTLVPPLVQLTSAR